MASHVVGHLSELPPGSRKIVDVNGRSIGVFNVDGRLYALRNVCPHQGAPLCLGAVAATAHPSAPGEYLWSDRPNVIVCPWHGWEFELATGKSVFNPHGTRVRAYDVTVESVDTFPLTVEDDGVVLIHL